ncbi:MAG: UDP-3-O-[3-hydroxymyristoyl] N-acetylglucosamine deacetylase [Paracoccaceae bacterium]|jgi:UDP-3-O-[3-hydroxymyristoyl] N-acetylglucosamine deacetylase
MQATLKTAFTVNGVGLHSGRAVRMTVSPAAAGTGIWFKRSDRVEGDAYIPARWDMVERSRLCTLIKNADGVSVSTIEHIMAALAGCGIHNALVEVSGPEVPIVDGSAAPFVAAILKAGVQHLDVPVRAIRVLKTVEVTEGDAVARIAPAFSLSIDFEIDFADAAIGRQSRCLNMANGAFVRELCDSRTFCRKSDVDAMQAAGLALGGSLRNAVVVDGASVLSPGGFRHPDEPVRHKMLDALGDLALAGAPLLGAYTGYKAGHALTNRLLHALFADPTNTQIVSCGPSTVRNLPGVGVRIADLRAVA